VELLTERGMTTFDGAVYGNEVQSTLDLTWHLLPSLTAASAARTSPNGCLSRITYLCSLN
jgi:hypothetical protein